MNALKTTRRLTLLMILLIIALTATTALAKDGEHGYLGVMFQKITTSMASALQLDDDEGVMISEVIDDGPADKAGLEDGDVILKFDGKDIEDFSDLSKAVQKTSPNEVVTLKILHNGKRQDVDVEMGASKNKVFDYSFSTDGDSPRIEFFSEGDDDDVFVMSGGGQSRVWTDDDGTHRVVIKRGGEHDGKHGRGHEGMWIGDDGDEMTVIVKDLMFNDDRGFMGVELEDISEQLGEYFGVDNGEGALISKVQEDSPAAAAGFKAGDIIVKVADESIESSADVHEALSDTEPEQKIEVEVRRKGKNKTIKVTLGEAPEHDFDFDFEMPHMAKMPHMMKRFPGGGPHGMKHDIRMFAPEGKHRVREIHEFLEGSDDLKEVREELKELREELKELQRDLKK